MRYCAVCHCAPFYRFAWSLRVEPGLQERNVILCHNIPHHQAMALTRCERLKEERSQRPFEFSNAEKKMPETSQRLYGYK